MRRSTTCLSTIDQRSFVSRKWHRGGGRVEIRTNIVEKGEAGRGPRDGRGDSPWNTNGFRDNGHWPGVVHPHSPSNEDSTRSRLEVSFPPQVSPFHINPIRAEGKGDRHRLQQLRSTSLFTISSAISWIGISLRETYFSLRFVEICFEYSVPGKFLRVVDGMDSHVSTIFRIILWKSNRILFETDAWTCGLVWSEVSDFRSIEELYR